MQVDVIWKSFTKGTEDSPILNRGYWDYGMLEAIFKNELWTPINQVEFSHHDDYPDEFDGGIIVIPARHNAQYAEQLNKDIQNLLWCIIILAGDEEGVFPTEKLSHPNMRVYVMTPHGKPKADRFIVNGWPPQITELKKFRKEMNNRPVSFFFAGQVTHKARKDCIKALDKLEGGRVIQTAGFTKGVNPTTYFGLMASAKIAICPPGPVIEDTFRLYEGLEAGCLPVVGNRAYWEYLFGEEPPFAFVDDWSELPVQYNVDTYPLNANKAFAWWQKKKREMSYNVLDDIEHLAMIDKSKDPNDLITVLIPTSPIAAHPSLAVIEETVNTIREKLPRAEIFIMVDGIRDEQIEYKERYEEYKRQLLLKCNFDWHNVLPILFDTHHHQVAMTRKTLEMVRTPIILFAEHDTPLCEEIPFPNLCEAILKGDANMIRLHHEALILDVHKDLMLDDEAIESHGIPMVRTGQWSQRPHLARTEFYKHILNTYFSSAAKCMIEDGIHGKVNMAFRQRGQAGWNEFKVWIYAPQTGNMKRSYHIDSRGEDSKFDDTFVY